MPTWSAEYIDSQIALYQAALEKVLQKQSYKIGDRELTYANIKWIEESLSLWQQRKATQTIGRRGRIASIRTAC